MRFPGRKCWGRRAPPGFHREAKNVINEGAEVLKTVQNSIEVISFSVTSAPEDILAIPL